MNLMGLVLLVILILLAFISVRLLPFILIALFFWALLHYSPDGADRTTDAHPPHYNWDTRTLPNVSIESMCRQESEVIVRDLLTLFFETLSENSKLQLSQIIYDYNSAPNPAIPLDELRILDELNDKDAFAALPRKWFDRRVSTVIRREQEKWFIECTKERTYDVRTH